MTSRHHYKYLYNDLLKWHARRSLIPTPKHKIYCKKHIPTSITIVPSNKPRVLLLQVDFDDLFVKDVTRMYVSIIGSFDSPNGHDYYHARDMGSEELYRQFKLYRNFDILRGYYQYVHRDALLIYVNMRQPVFTLNWRLIKYLRRKLHSDDKYNLNCADII